MLTGNQEKVRKINRSIVLSTLRLGAPASRARIANLTGLNRATVSNIVNELIDEGLIREEQEPTPGIGRPAFSLTLNPEGGAVVGVEIGVDFIAVLLTDFAAQSLWETRINVAAGQSQSQILAQAEALVDQALNLARGRKLRPLGLGIGVPGLVNVEQGTLIMAPNLHWRDVPLRLMLNQRFNLPTFIENEANLAALGEYYFGIARGVENFVYLSSGIGLGGGILLGGRLMRGQNGFAGEIGHMRRNRDGERCGCGRIGCWETEVGPRAVLRRVTEQLQTDPDQELLDACNGDFSNLTFEMVVQFGLAGDDTCRGAIEDVASSLGEGIADLVNAFDPELVVIGGAFTLGKDILRPIIEETVLASALQPTTHGLRIAFSERGDNACVYGAVAIVLDDIFREMVIS
jgi:glucokinase-like ROK family protein